MKQWRWPSMSSPRARRGTCPSGSKPSTRAIRCGANKNVRVLLQWRLQRYKTNHVRDLPPLHTCLHHRRVHCAVRGEDLGAEERINLHCCILCNHYHQEPFDLVKAKAGNEEDDNLKTGLSF